MHRIKNIMGCLLLLISLGACQKAELVKTWSEFVDVSFDPSHAALDNNGEGKYLSARYNGHPIDWNLMKIRVVAGEGRFEFYDNRTGETLLDSTIDVKAGSEEKYYLFQPTMESPLSFFDPNEIENEELPPAGNLKLKIANYAQALIPFENVDVKITLVYYDWDFIEYRRELGTIKNISSSVGEGGFKTIPDGLTDDVIVDLGYGYIFTFLDSKTGEPLLNHGGTPYECFGIFPEPGKTIYSLYLSTMKAWGEAPIFIKKGDDFYDVTGNILSSK